MSFIWPVMLGALVLIPLLAGLFLLQARQARRRAAKYGGFGVAQPSDGQRGRGGPGTTWLLFLAGISVLLLALARPQATVMLPRVQGTVILAFDVSGSMAADDFKPTRMDAAKAAAEDFVAQQPQGVQIGVVAFSDTGFAVQPPSSDKEEVLAAINRLSPQRGTSVANGIAQSLVAIASAQNPVPTRFYTNLTPAPTAVPTPMPAGQYTNATIVLLSDGENNENPDPMTAAQAAADRGVRIYTIGVGSPQGTTLHINGFTVHTQLDEAALQNIAQKTGGAYYNAPSGADLKRIYDNLNPQVAIRPEQLEITSMLGGLGAALLVVGGLLSMLRFGRVP